jgi:hypothetical protein
LAISANNNSYSGSGSDRPKVGLLHHNGRDHRLACRLKCLAGLHAAREAVPTEEMWNASAPLPLWLRACQAIRVPARVAPNSDSARPDSTRAERASREDRVLCMISAPSFGPLRGTPRLFRCLSPGSFVTRGHTLFTRWRGFSEAGRLPPVSIRADRRSAPQ